MLQSTPSSRVSPPAGRLAHPASREQMQRDFPTLSLGEVYLDSAASSLTPTSVIGAMNEYYTNYRANVNRGIYASSMRASAKYEDAHARIARFIGAQPDELVITSNATHALNLLALSLDFRPGDEVIIPSIEHSSNMLPWVRLVKKAGIKIHWVNPDKLGVLHVEAIGELINARTKLISVAHVSNIVGSVAPIEALSALARERGILLCVDACQSAPHMKLDVRKLGCDFLVFSGHKMLGPTGVGGLYVRQELLEVVAPALLGSESIPANVCPGLNACAVGGMPHPKWTVAGTPPIAEVIGLGAAISYLEEIGLDAIHQHSLKLVEHALVGLRQIPGVTIFGPESIEQRTSIVAFNVGSLSNEDVGMMLTENFNVAVRAGTHCALGYFMEVQAPTEAYGNVRASFYLYNTMEDVDRLLGGVREIAKSCL